MPAYSLIQFTAPNAVSRDRRTRLRKVSAAYAAAHGLTLDKTRNVAPGAFRGRMGGDPLTRFLRAIEGGSIAPDSTLLAESLEGILPASPKDIIQRFSDIIARGITIVTFPDQITHDGKTIAAHPDRLFLSLIGMIKAQEATHLRRQIAIQYRKIAESKLAHDPRDLGVSAYRGNRTGRENQPIQSQGTAK